mgnify:CR=1 FL=1
MRPGTFSRRGIAVWKQESPSLQGGEDVKIINDCFLPDAAVEFSFSKNHPHINKIEHLLFHEKTP